MWTHFIKNDTTVSPNRTYIVFGRNSSIMTQNDFIEALLLADQQFLLEFRQVLLNLSYPYFYIEFSPILRNQNPNMQFFAVQTDAPTSPTWLAGNHRLAPESATSIKAYLKDVLVEKQLNFFQEIGRFIRAKLDEGIDIILSRWESDVTYIIYTDNIPEMIFKGAEFIMNRIITPVETVSGKILDGPDGLKLYSNSVESLPNDGRYIIYTIPNLTYENMAKQLIESTDFRRFIQRAWLLVPFTKFDIFFASSALPVTFVAIENLTLPDFSSNVDGPVGVFPGDEFHPQHGTMLHKTGENVFWPIKSNDITNYAHIGGFVRTANPTVMENFLSDLGNFMLSQLGSYYINIAPVQRWLAVEFTKESSEFLKGISLSTVQQLSYHRQWHFDRVPWIGGEGYWLILNGENQAIHWDQVFEFTGSFVDAWIRALSQIPYDKYYVEFDSDNPVRVLIAKAGDELSNIADRTPFEDKIANATSRDFITFLNLSGDGYLVVPLPKSSVINYANISTFTRTADIDTQKDFWNFVIDVYRKRLSLRPNKSSKLWLSTHGTGVKWLHVRIDTAPKYYHFGQNASRPLITPISVPSSFKIPTVFNPSVTSSSTSRITPTLPTILPSLPSTVKIIPITLPLPASPIQRFEINRYLIKSIMKDSLGVFVANLNEIKKLYPNARIDWDNFLIEAVSVGNREIVNYIMSNLSQFRDIDKTLAEANKIAAQKRFNNLIVLMQSISGRTYLQSLREGYALGGWLEELERLPAIATVEELEILIDLASKFGTPQNEKTVAWLCSRLNPQYIITVNMINTFLNCLSSGDIFRYRMARNIYPSDIIRIPMDIALPSIIKAAAEGGHINYFETVINQTNEPALYYPESLYIAAFNGRHEFVRKFLNYGIGPVLLGYAESGYLAELVDIIQQYNITMNDITEILTAAATNDHLEIVRYLVERYKPPDMTRLNIALKSATTPDSNRFEITNFLIDGINITPEYEKSLLLASAESGDLRLVSKLIPRFIDILSEVLLSVIRSGNIDTFRYIIKNFNDRITPIMYRNMFDEIINSNATIENLRMLEIIIPRIDKSYLQSKASSPIFEDVDIYNLLQFYL